MYRSAASRSTQEVDTRFCLASSARTRYVPADKLTDARTVLFLSRDFFCGLLSAIELSLSYLVQHFTSQCCTRSTLTRRWANKDCGRGWAELKIPALSRVLAISAYCTRVSKVGFSNDATLNGSDGGSLGRAGLDAFKLLRAVVGAFGDISLSPPRELRTRRSTLNFKDAGLVARRPARPYAPWACMSPGGNACSTF